MCGVTYEAITVVTDSSNDLKWICGLMFVVCLCVDSVFTLCCSHLKHRSQVQYTVVVLCISLSRCFFLVYLDISCVFTS